MGLHRKYTTLPMAAALAVGCAQAAAGQPASDPTPTAASGANARDRGVKVIRAEPTPVPSVTKPVIKACPRPFKASIRLSDTVNSRTFDRALSRLLMAKSGPVTIDLAKPYGADGDPPAALLPWLNEVKASGGTLSTAQYCQGARGMFNFFRKLLGINRAEPYKAARDYDAVLQIDGVDQTVTQVRFVPRSTSR